MYALVDGNNFYVSCERVFRPSLNGRPVIVLIVQLVQGSEAWLSHRQGLRNASETPAVLGISPWMTPYQLWLLKTGRSETVVNEAMRRGTALEPAARAAYDARTGLVMQHLVLQDGDTRPAWTA